jgi:hypothetical protein
MGALDILKTGADIIGLGGKKGPTEGGNGIFGTIMETVGLKKPEVAAQAGEAKEHAEAERSSIFGEVGKSMFLRQFPRMAAIFDIGKQVTGNKAAEVVPWQNEFETITAFMILIPNKWKHFITDIFANSTIFQKLVEFWPGLDGVNLPLIGSSGFLSGTLPILGKGGPLRERILTEKDPDAVIQALRIMHQDVFVTGKVSFDLLREKLGIGGSLAVLGGGAAALTAGSAMLEGNNPLSGIMGGGKEKVGGPSGKKLNDIIKAHPEVAQTKMQQNLVKILQGMNVMDSAELVKGKWEGNNDEVTVGFIYDNAKYFLVFDNDVSSTDFTLNTSDGRQIDKFTDWGGIDAGDDAKRMIAAIRKSPAPQLPAATAPANDNATPAAKPAEQPKKAA